MAQEHQSEGIVLSSIPFKDNDRLVTVISPDFGLLKLYMRGVNRPKNKFFALKEPLTHFEFVFREKRGDFHLFLEGKLLHSFLDVRSSYPHLMSSFELLRCISKSLVPSEPYPEIYLLFKKYLLNLHRFKHPSILVSSFYLKILLFEGLLNLKTSCTKCQKKTSTLYFFNKDYYCSNCCPQKNLSFSLEELQKIFKWVQTRSFEAFQTQSPSKILSEKIKKLYSALHEIEL